MKSFETKLLAIVDAEIASTLQAKFDQIVCGFALSEGALKCRIFGPDLDDAALEKEFDVLEALLLLAAPHASSSKAVQREIEEISRLLDDLSRQFRCACGL